MAIINCPECGEKISSNAENCIHCGCKITYCEECGKVFVGEPDVCDACGFVFKKKNEETKNVKSDKNIDQLFIEFKTESLINNIFCHAIIPYLVALVALIVWGIGIYKIFSYGGNIDSLNSSNDIFADLNKKTELLANFNNAANEIKTLFIIGIIIYTLFIPFNELRELYICEKFARWCKFNKVDLTEQIKKELSIDITGFTTEKKFEIASNVLIGVESQMYYIDTNLKKECLKRTLFKTILVLIGLILIGIFIIDNSQVYMLYKINKAENSASFSIGMLKNVTLPIIGVVVLIANFIMNHSFFKDLMKEKPKEWVKKNIPEYFERYSEYTNFDEIINKKTL